MRETFGEVAPDIHLPGFPKPSPISTFWLAIALHIVDDFLPIPVFSNNRDGFS
ncbi:MAG: hypothetical protein RID09_14430 [Coleofasciculus sp. G1-WW12-02]|uniref:hypothetical protein n=1 Tax=Coleofasciculus sp. TaxID=3100458 RepID=UPI0032FD4EDD